MKNASLLDQTLKAAGLPIDGISIGTADDRATWTVQWTSPPTPTQQQHAADLLAAFVAPVTTDKAPDLTPAAVLAWCAGKLGVDSVTAATEAAQPQKVAP